MNALITIVISMNAVPTTGRRVLLPGASLSRTTATSRESDSSSTCVNDTTMSTLKMSTPSGSSRRLPTGYM